MTSEVISTIITAASTLGLGAMLMKVVDRFLPSKKDIAELRKTSAEGRKTKAESDQLDLEIHVKMNKLLDEETQKHAHIFYKREMEYRAELDRLMEKLREAHKNIEVYVLKLQESYDRINYLMDEQEKNQKKQNST